MEANDEYSNEEEFSTDPDPQITEENLSLEENSNPILINKWNHQVKLVLHQRKLSWKTNLLLH